MHTVRLKGRVTWLALPLAALALVVAFLVRPVGHVGCRGADL